MKILNTDSRKSEKADDEVDCAGEGRSKRVTALGKEDAAPRSSRQRRSREPDEDLVSSVDSVKSNKKSVNTNKVNYFIYSLQEMKLILVYLHWK